MRVFLIGGTGFLGYHTAKELLKRGHEVTILALPPLPSEGLFAPEVKIQLADFSKLSDDQIVQQFSQHDALVFAAGADDRSTPKKPAYPFFFHHNVVSVRRLFTLASQSGMKRGVVLGSYFAYFNRIWPEMQLAKHHPYIRSRVEQEETAFSAGGSSMDVMVLELPYIFGSMPGRIPMWKPLIKYVISGFPVFYPAGGTTCVSARQVAQAIAGALEFGKAGECYPIGGQNLTWIELLTKIGTAAGRKPNIITLQKWIVKFGAVLLKLNHKLRGLESGLDPVEFINLQTKNTFIDPVPVQQVLKYSNESIDQAIAETVNSSLMKI